MKPVSPVVHGAESFEVTFAKNQPEYLPLPALPVNDNSRYITRWRMTWRERIRAFVFGDVYLWITTGGRPLQPVALTVERPVIKTPEDFPQDPVLDWSMNDVAQKHGHVKQAALGAF